MSAGIDGTPHPRRAGAHIQRGGPLVVASSEDRGVAPSPRPVRKDVRRNRAHLLQAADALIRERGIELSLNTLAHRAGVGVGTVYRHFPDPHSVLKALLEQRIEHVAQILADHADAADPVDGLRSAVLAVCEIQADDRAVWEVLSSGTREEQRARIRDRMVPLVDVLVQRATATGRMRDGFAPTDIPVLLWSGGALSEFLRGASPTAWRRYIDVMLDGLVVSNDQSRTHLIEHPLTHDDIDSAMRNWRPDRTQRPITHSDDPS